MRSIQGRLSKLERQLGLSDKGPRLLVIASDYRRRAIDGDACVKILDEAGFLHTTGIVLVNLMDIPTGLNAEQTEKFLREEGFKICPNGPRSGARAAGSE
jgi:hypothetical protein